MIGEFKKFILRGNIIDLAVGIIIGAAFNKIVNSLVNDVVMPPMGLILGKVDFKGLYINLSTTPYASITEATEASAPIIRYGLFITNVIDFVLMALVIFLIIRYINKLKTPPKVPAAQSAVQTAATKDCEYCFSEIPLQATRCPHCTSQLIKVTVTG